MSFITKNYNWPAQDLAAVAQTQTVALNTPLVLNGTLSTAVNGSAMTTAFGSVDFPCISRTLAFTLSAISSATTFLVSGLRDGQFVQETISSNTSATYETVNYFDTVTNILCIGTSAIPSTVKVGSGLTGWTRPLVINSFITSSPVYTAIQTMLKVGTVSYNVLGTITKMYNGFQGFSNPIYLNELLVNSASGQFLSPNPATASSFITAENLPLTGLSVNIVSSSNDAALTIAITTPRLST